MPKRSRLSEQFGDIDIYLFDQILRGRAPAGSRMLDAGCGAGSNLIYLLGAAEEEQYQLFGVDSDAEAISSVRRIAASLAPGLPSRTFSSSRSRGCLSPMALPTW